jgi:hypothetical protein
MTSALGRWLDGLLNKVIGPFVRNLVVDLLRDLLVTQATVLLGTLSALGGIILEAFRVGALWWARLQIQILNSLPFVDLPVPEAPKARDFTEIAKEAVAASNYLAREVYGGLLPAPATSKPQKLATPGLELTKVKLPPFPLAIPPPGGAEAAPPTAPAPTPAPAAPSPAAPAPAAAPGPTSITVNGGISVVVTAGPLTRDGAEEAARAIAAGIMDELRRLTDRERFRRGLPATAVP